jgi:SAM-dependent methyltransferase
VCSTLPLVPAARRSRRQACRAEWGSARHRYLPAILEHAADAASAAGFTNVATREMDGEELEIEDESYDAVISRVDLIYFPDQLLALQAQRRALRPGGRVGAIVYSTPDRNEFFSIPVSIIRPRQAAPSGARPAGSVQPRRRWGDRGAVRACRLV